MRKRWLERMPWRGLAAVLAGGFAALNLLAYTQARAMTHFASGGSRTAERPSLGETFAVLLRGVRLPRPPIRATPDELGLAFETATFPGYRGLTAEAWVIPAKGRGPILMFHGYNDSKSSLLRTAAEFHRMGFDTVLVDFNGSGGSAGEDTSLGYHEAEVVASAVSWAGRRFPGRKPVLYGLSMGAAAILRAVGAEGVGAAAMIIESPFDRMLRAVGRRFERRGIPAFPLAPLLLWWGGWRQEFDGFRHNPVEYARGVGCPTLVLFGDQDEYIRLAETEEIHGNLAGPKALKVFRGVAHQRFAEVRPDEWREAVRAFMVNYAR